MFYKGSGFGDCFPEREYFMDEKSKTQEILEKLDMGLTELFDSEVYKKYLDTMSKFHNYSFNNTLLIAMQNPDATFVAGYEDWKRKFNRQVNKGEKGIHIIAPAPYKKEIEKEKVNPITGSVEIIKEEIIIPSYKAVAVFDLSQTKGEPLPTLGVDELNGEVKDWDTMKKILLDISSVPISYEAITNGCKGYYNHESKKIVVKEGMDPIQELKTSIHEVAHALLHDKDGAVIDEIENVDLNSRTREVQAESIAYAVCQHLGIDTSDYSFGYIAGWSSGKDKKELKESMETIRKTTNYLIYKIEKSLAEIKKLEKEETTELKEEKIEQKRSKTKKKIS